jgi:outer membrane protein OmpA-like peptidoglycan-associated protein
MQRNHRLHAARAAQRGIGLVALVALALACSTPTPLALIDARTEYQLAAADANVQQNASVELYEAGKALERAESEWKNEEDVKETEHLSYLVKRRVEITKLWASGRKAYKEGQELQQRSALEANQMVNAADAARREAERARLAAEAAAERERKLRTELAELQARETARGLELTLGDVLFDVDQASLKPGAVQNLGRLAAFLKDYPDRAVLVEGHTDNTGSDEYNQSLSERRAESVRSFLISDGVDAQRVLARGYGKSYPIAGNDSAAGRQLNRRVEIVILKAGQSPEGRLRPAAS